MVVKEEELKMMREIYNTRRLLSHICVKYFGQYPSGVIYSRDHVDHRYKTIGQGWSISSYCGKLNYCVN